MAANSLTLSWSASTGTTPITYQAWFRVSGAGTWTSFSANAVSPLTVTGLTASTLYDFFIIATNGVGQSTTPTVSSATSSGNAFPAAGRVAGSQNTGSAAPIITGPQNGAATVSVPLSISGVSLADAGATSGTLLTTCSSGTLAMTLAGAAVAGSGTASISLAASFANCQSAVGTLVYTPPAAPLTDTISIAFTDQASAHNTLLIQILVTAAPVATAPNAPTGLTATAPTTTSMQLNWAASTAGSAPISYQPKVSSSGANNFVANGSATNGLTAVVTGLTAGVSYDFEVVASNTAGSATSAIVTASTATASVAPSAATNLQVTATTATTLTFTWSPPATGTAPISYQPQFRQTAGTPVLTTWYRNPGQDGSFWKCPFYTTATFDTTSANATLLRNGNTSPPTPKGYVHLVNDYCAPWAIGTASDPLIPVTAANGKTISVRIPVGTVTEKPTSGVDNVIGGADTTQPYLCWTANAAVISGNGIIQASGSSISCNNIALDDATGPIMCDAVTGQPGTGNDFGTIQDYELTLAVADSTYVIPHMLAYALDPLQVNTSLVWPLALADTSFANTGTVPQGHTIGIPRTVARPAGKTRGFYLLFDNLQRFGWFYYNVSGNGCLSMGCYQTSSGNAALATDVYNSISAVMAYVGILTNQSGLSTLKGLASGGVLAYPAPPVLDLSPTSGKTIAPYTFGAWYPSTKAPLGPNGTGYNVTETYITPTGTPGPFAPFGSTIPGTSVTITGLIANTSYDLNVIASNSFGSTTSASVTSTTGLTGIPGDVTGTQARPAQDMLNRFGINTHFGQGLYSAYTPAQAIAAIQTIGATLVRDSDNG